VNKLAVIVLLLGLSACSKKKTEEGREPVQGATSGAVVGSAAPTAPSPAPAPVTPPNGSAPAGGSAAAPASVGCAAASSLVCAADQVDGCMSGLTTVHLCVAKDAKPGAVCAQPGTPCPAGQVDACLHDPPQSIHHVCVVAAKPAPKSGL
jgi:hypothetical protein